MKFILTTWLSCSIAANHTNILTVTAIRTSCRLAAAKVAFCPVTRHVLQTDGSFSRAEVAGIESLDRVPQAQLPANHRGVGVAPLSVADGSPTVLGVHLNPSSKLAAASDQP